MGNDKNLELIVEQLESHPSLKNSFYGFAYFKEIEALIDSATTSQVFQSTIIKGNSLSIKIGLNTYRLEFGKKINTQATQYYGENKDEKRKYKLRQLAAMTNFDDWMVQIASNQEIAELLRNTEYGYSVLARLDRLDESGKIVSSRPLLLIPGVMPENSQNVYQWEEINSTRDHLVAKLLRKSFSVYDIYKEFCTAYDNAVLSSLQKVTDLVRSMRIPKF